MKSNSSASWFAGEYFLLDTGPLQEFFVLRYETETRRGWPDRTFQRHALQTQLDKEDFTRFVTAHEGRLGTSFHVIGEMYGFLRKAEDGLPTNARADLKRRFWQLVRSTFRNLRMTERAVAVVDMLEEILVQLGPVDAGLLELAKEPVERGGPVVVLTADTRLFQLCGQHGVRAEYVPDRLEEFRQMR